MPTCTQSASLSSPAGIVPHIVNNIQFSRIQDYQSPEPNLTATGKQRKQYLVRENCSKSTRNCKICSCFLSSYTCINDMYIMHVRLLLIYCLELRYCYKQTINILIYVLLLPSIAFLDLMSVIFLKGLGHDLGSKF